MDAFAVLPFFYFFLRYALILAPLFSCFQRRVWPFIRTFSELFHADPWCCLLTRQIPGIVNILRVLAADGPDIWDPTLTTDADEIGHTESFVNYDDEN